MNNSLFIKCNLVNLVYSWNGFRYNLIVDLDLVKKINQVEDDHQKKYKQQIVVKCSCPFNASSHHHSGIGYKKSKQKQYEMKIGNYSREIFIYKDQVIEKGKNDNQVNQVANFQKHG